MNAIPYDRHKEEKAVELFAANVVSAGTDFLENPMDTPFLAPWNRVVSAMPEILRDLRTAVEEDTEEFKASL